MITRPLSVFIVEESPVVRERLIELVDDVADTHCVGNADGATAAIEGITELHPDVVLLDLVLHEGNGIQVAEAIGERSPKTTMVVLTNLATSAARRRCARLGVKYFFDKTMDFDALREVLRRLH
jgi:DNA-binding NarL/FixJ family response regulator